VSYPNRVRATTGEFPDTSYEGVRREDISLTAVPVKAVVAPKKTSRYNGLAINRAVLSVACRSEKTLKIARTVGNAPHQPSTVSEGLVALESN
jgi:hypothetical protein